SSTDTENVAGATNRPVGKSSAQIPAACMASSMPATLGNDARKPLIHCRCLTVAVLIVSLHSSLELSEFFAACAIVTDKLIEPKAYAAYRSAPIVRKVYAMVFRVPPLSPCGRGDSVC